jgi:NRPS condensation-like uncharacterized protein
MSRPLSDIEKAIWMVDQEVRQNFVMVVSLSHESGPLTESVLRQALDMVKAKHPPLRWKIKEGDIPEFVSDNVPQIPLHIIQRKDDNHWLEVTEKEMDEAFPFTEGPFARVVLLSSKNKSDLLVTFCHIATDATSGVTVVKELLTIAGKLRKGETPEPEPSLPEPPSSVEVLRKDLKYPPAFLDISTRIKQALHKPVELPGDRDVPPEKRITRIIHNVLIPEVLKKLVARCKKEKSSVHTALCAAFFQAVMEQIRKKQDLPKKGSLMLGCITAVNIRHLFTQPMEEDIGYFISFSVHYQMVNENSSLWSIARKIRKAMHKEIKYGRDIKAILGVGEALKEFSKPIDLVRAINSSNPPVAATNLGRVDIPVQYGDLILEKLHFPVAIHFDTKNGLAIAVTTFRNQLTLNLLYAEPYISKDTANIINDSMMKRLKEAIRE